MLQQQLPPALPDGDTAAAATSTGPAAPGTPLMPPRQRSTLVEDAAEVAAHFASHDFDLDDDDNDNNNNDDESSSSLSSSSSNQDIEDSADSATNANTTAKGKRQASMMMMMMMMSSMASLGTKMGRKYMASKK